jgi:hypothetical protein
LTVLITFAFYKFSFLFFAWLRLQLWTIHSVISSQIVPYPNDTSSAT